ncbi:DUF1906 domain-containing protein [Labedella phragmitis]|uniref:DUF1906 domain-containing protein n=1 Tax=Labedella phragmitis TaxID=2498849 RepID=A0A3S4DIQ3_9MICO|nr:glycoside hydrolase domain-containing protein [Labedella phragmitis]RWZ49536.1 DUF1906 domain-containing protein [Labedella phragmitis]
MADPWVQAAQDWYNVTYSARPGFETLIVDGVSGWATMYALTRALQYELGISSLSDSFGAGTLAALTSFGTITASNPNTSAGPSNIVKIAQAGLYCKGYNADGGDLKGRWATATQLAVTSLRGDLGLGTTSSDLTPKLFKFLLTMDAARLLPGGDSVVRDGQRSMNARHQARRDYFFVPADGYFLRDTHRALLFALQYELGMADGVANGNFGPGTKSGLQTQANLSTGSSDTTKHFVRLFHLALRVNGYATTFTGTFTSTTATHTNSFQSFVGLPPTGTADLQTWASLLVSTGDPDRPGTGADCVTTLTAEKLATLRNAGYVYFGRYLTNVPDYSLDKCIKHGELERIFASGGRVFPLFQTGGASISHFTPRRGAEVGEEAANAAWGYGLPNNTIIYFSVDFDALPYQVTDAVIPYFQGIQQRLQRTGRTYRVGVYGPRDVCRQLLEAGLAVSSFVSDMSTGYAGNLGKPLPASWAFDQIRTLTVGSGTGAIEIDKNVVSGRYAGINQISPTIRTTADPRIPAVKLDAFEAEWFRACLEHEDSIVQPAVMVGNRPNVKSRVSTHDQYITELATTLGVPKALIMTPLIWEGMVINPGDAGADALVAAYYAAKELGQTPPPGSRSDSSTGVCQAKAETAIRANNWGVSQGIVTSRSYDAAVWQDMWDMWRLIKNDEESAILMGALTMMMEASGAGGASRSQLRQMTPSQVMAMCVGYNNSWFDGGTPAQESMVYGRNRMQLYYTIKRWHQSF